MSDRRENLLQVLKSHCSLRCCFRKRLPICSSSEYHHNYAAYHFPMQKSTTFEICHVVHLLLLAAMALTSIPHSTAVVFTPWTWLLMDPWPVYGWPGLHPPSELEAEQLYWGGPAYKWSASADRAGVAEWWYGSRSDDIHALHHHEHPPENSRGTYIITITIIIIIISIVIICSIQTVFL